MSIEPTICPRCESTCVVPVLESMGITQWICDQCSHQWDFASPEERALVPKHLTGGRIEQFLEESREDEDLSAASASKASELFLAWWPSSSFPNPGWPDVVQNFKCAHRILTTNGFLIVADPENVTGDGKSWVLECKPTAKLPKDADPADLARQYLESEGVKVDEVGQLDESDRTLYVLLGPPPQPITSVEVQEEPQTTRQTKLLQKIYGAVDAHEGENPPTEYGAREPMKRAGQALGVTPTPLPQPEVQRVAATSVTGEALGRDRLPPPPLSPLLIRPSVGEGARQINSRSIRRRPFSVSLRPA